MDRDWDMQRVLSHYGLEVQPGTRWRSVRCPFHSDQHASARVCLTGFACLACGIKGDAIKVIMKVENAEFGRALELYESITGDRRERVRQSVKRKSWGIPPFGEGPDRPVDYGFQARIRKGPDLGG